jgi:alanine racemase
VTLTLYVDGVAWRRRAGAVLDRYGDVIAVVKGNGYGFGRRRLAGIAGELGVERLAVGTVHELAGLPATAALAELPAGATERPIVLTPASAADALVGAEATLTVGSVLDVVALTAAGHREPVVVKLASSMRRYGAEPDELPALLGALAGAGLAVDSFALHLPLTGDPVEVEAWVPFLPAGVPLAVSHLDAEALATIRRRHPDRRFPVRLGTALWHGDKATLALRADVMATRPIEPGQSAGYRQVGVPGAGTLVMVGTGTAHGIHPLPDGRSPFHFGQRRLELVEPPHMHTSMLWVPDGAQTPSPGQEVDVQQPLTFVEPDRIIEEPRWSETIFGSTRR